MKLPDRGEPGPIENLCLEHRIACRGKDYLDEPCVCALLRWGYDLGRAEALEHLQPGAENHS